MKKLNILLMLLFTIIIIRRVDYVLVPEGNYSNGKQGYKQEIKITFEEGVIQVDKYQIRQEFIPYGKVKMNVIPRSGATNYYTFEKVKGE